jgi:hypothetical protein
MKTKWSSMWPTMLSIVIYLASAALVIGLIGWATAWGLSELKKANVFVPEIGLTILLIMGVGTLILVFSMLTPIFAALGLADGKRAMGLPEGSIRAFIAIMLILLFIIVSVFLYEQLDWNTYTLESISQETLDKIPIENIVSIDEKQAGGRKVFNVQIKVLEATEQSEDFAKQMFTTIGTLVVSLAGFYFGAQSVSIAKGGVAEKIKPLIRKMSKTEGQQGETLMDVQIDGRDFKTIKSVKLVNVVSDKKGEINAEGITTSSDMIICDFKIGTEDEAGDYALVVTAEDGNEDRYDGIFKVVEKPAETT